MGNKKLKIFFDGISKILKSIKCRFVCCVSDCNQPRQEDKDSKEEE